MCDSVVAVGAETASGRTLFGKNSDRKGDECQPFVQHVEAWYPAGSRLRCTHIEIPQVPETYRLMGHSPHWVWGLEHGVNEHGVAIGNHTVFSNEPVEEAPGLIGMDLVRLGLERGRTAREALEMIAMLIETHGQGGAARAPDGAGYHNSFLLADASEAWVLETSGRHWAARRTTLAACSNHHALTTDWQIASRDLEGFARTQGWWRKPDRLDLAAAYRNPHVPPHISSGRHRRAQALLAEGRGKHDVASFAHLLRDHGDGGAFFTAVDAGPDDERFFTLCAHSEPVHWTTASLVVELPELPTRPWAAWVSFGTPCTGIFLPVYLHGTLPAALARDVAEADAPSAWRTFKSLQDAVSLDPERHTPSARRAWSALEARIASERGEIERDAHTTTLSGDPDAAAALLSEFMERNLSAVLERANELAAQLAR